MDDLDDITGGDQRRADALRAVVKQLGRSDNPLLREMATAVQHGELSLRQAASSSTYSGELSQPFRAFWRAYQDLTTQERDDLASRF
ncbi:MULTISPECIES: hypothetical protein [Micromonospora]|uniref:Uncharacterized protein n=1 Tax=Micromonospora solifontis TaxID=2487138 RepID=A0ABX9WNU7_9ACTN|nr:MULTISPECIES: hypothetical protein [Micromonospora]NES13259.1 hypothetical protein [Micromonospora sp. PPF5-17B]NES34628.1 hypothetical protein [Micromonospora solifontis]NES57008.1 hypothetical protein [Micromonospora sp. PPF5-6]RNM01873.1 hypothetical protein EFE23_00385 [Micromonospora solifontis]